MADIPAGLLAFASRGPAWADWLDGLPRLLREVLGEWELVVDGRSVHGNTALVVPVLTADGRRAALKIGWPHAEAEHEALALQRWGGRGAVRLLRADPRRWALLLERLGTEDLRAVDDVEACEIVGRLSRQLQVPAAPQLRTLSAQAARWADELAVVASALPVPHRMVDHARSLARDFASDERTDGILIHTDLHFSNVLRDGADWAAIDPKPLSGDPHYEIAPMLWNRIDLTRDFREVIRRRFVTLVDAIGLDEDRARDWVIVRMLVTVKGELEDNGTPDPDWLTAMLAIAKAVQ